jgi:hypothetical protein
METLGKRGAWILLAAVLVWPAGAGAVTFDFWRDWFHHRFHDDRDGRHDGGHFGGGWRFDRHERDHQGERPVPEPAAAALFALGALLVGAHARKRR